MRRSRIAAAVAVGVLVGGVAAYATTAEGPPPKVTRDELAAYEEAVVPIVKDGGKVVQLGMKPAMDDLAHLHIVPPKVIGSEGDGWVLSLEQVRARLSRVPTPPTLREVTDYFLIALDRYTAAAREFANAARAAGSARATSLKRGVTLATSADHTYDRGSALLQAARHSVGLAPNPNFPEANDG